MKHYARSASALLLALLFSLGSSVPVLAADTATASITVQDTETGSGETTDTTDTTEVVPYLPQAYQPTLTDCSNSTLTIQWSASYASTVEGYQVVRVNAAGEIVEELKTTTDTTAKITGLSDGTKYRLAVRVYGTTNLGRRVYGECSEALEVATTPKSVTLKSVRYVSRGKIKLSWSKSSTASGYLIQYSTSKKFSDNGRTMSVKARKNTTTKTISGLAATTYYVRIVPYKKVGDTLYGSSWTKRQSVSVSSGLTIKERFNRFDTSDNSGKKTIRTLTDKGVNIANYSTTYDKVMAIYKWHVRHAREFSDCLSCNNNFNECLYALLNEPTDPNIWIIAGDYINNNGSLAMHKWSAVYLAGVPYLFDPRMQMYVNPSGTNYFGFAMNSTLAKQHYSMDGWYYCTNTRHSSSWWW